MAAARRQRDGPRALLRVRAAVESDRHRFGTQVIQLQQQAAARRAQTHFRLRPAQRAAHFTMKTVGAEQPQMVLVLRLPVVADRLAGLDGIAARDLRQISPVVDVKHRPLLAGIEQVQRYAPLLGRDAGLDVQLIGQCARRARQAALVWQTLAGGRRQRHLRQLFLTLAQAVGGVAAGGGQARQCFAVRIDKVERRSEIAAHRAAPGADVGFMHLKALFQKLQHRGVIENL